jgi:OOP family OmpA-OmpF porin
MRNILIVFMLSLFLLAAAVPGFAENQAGTVNLTPFTGFYTFDGRQAMDNGPYWGLRAGYNFTKSLGLEAMYGIVTTESQSRDDKYVGVSRYGIDALYHFNPDHNLVPFVAVGFAATHYDGPSGVTAQNRGMLDYGFGVKYFITEGVALRGDVRQAIFSEAGNNRINMEYTVGLTFALGAEKKAVAAAPMAKDTTPPYVTLAIPYNGNVDVPVHRRVRVAFSEPIDPATINSKTVTLSQGKTLIAGTVVAPTSTTASFTQANNLAPNTLYTGRVTAGVQDLAGNAMASDYVWSFRTAPAPATKVMIIDKLVMLEDTHFEFNKATLTKEGENMLKQNIQIMKDNPDMKVRIAGYASAAGTTAYNQDLSERRADAVKSYLVHEGGIAPERLDTIGYGETRPAIYEVKPSDLESKAAKANMRVLFEVIVK